MSKDKYKLNNWSAYNKGLKQRGSLNVWISSDVVSTWKYGGDNKRGGCFLYSDRAIELCLVVRKVYHLPLRQTEGFIQSFFERMGLVAVVPCYTTICRRSSSLAVLLSADNSKPLTDIVIDSTGLKVYGEGEWKVRKHGAGKHRTWMKLHIAADSDSQQIEAVTLTTNAVDDAAEVKPLLSQVQKKIRSVCADGAYDKDKVRKLLYKDKIRQIIPPQHNAVADRKKRKHRAERDEAIKAIAAIGRTEWKNKQGYHQRSKAETAVFRYKTIMGNSLASRKTEHQKTEVAVGCKILNLMLQTAKPQSIKIA